MAIPLPYDLDKLFQRTFGSKPQVPKVATPASAGAPFNIANGTKVSAYAPDGSTLFENYNGTEIWLPVRFKGLDTNLFFGGEVELPYSVVSISGSANWVETQLAERRGSAKELYSINDYKVTIKGFFIDRARVWPYDDLLMLKKVHEAGLAFSLDCALTNIYIPAEDKVVLRSFELPPVEGKSNHVRPYNMQLASDSIFTLELEQ